MLQWVGGRQVPVYTHFPCCSSQTNDPELKARHGWKQDSSSPRINEGGNLSRKGQFLRPDHRSLSPPSLCVCYRIVPHVVNRPWKQPIICRDRSLPWQFKGYVYIEHVATICRTCQCFVRSVLFPLRWSVRGVWSHCFFNSTNILMDMSFNYVVEITFDQNIYFWFLMVFECWWCGIFI